MAYIIYTYIYAYTYSTVQYVHNICVVSTPPYRFTKNETKRNEIKKKKKRRKKKKKKFVQFGVIACLLIYLLQPSFIVIHTIKHINLTKHSRLRFSTVTTCELLEL